MTIPRLERRCGSWVILSRFAPRPLCETHSSLVADTYARAGHEVVTAAQWLGRVNATVKAEGRS